jgi:hypothetical protein
MAATQPPQLVPAAQARPTSRAVQAPDWTTSKMVRCETAWQWQTIIAVLKMTFKFTFVKSQTRSVGGDALNLLISQQFFG